MPNNALLYLHAITSLHPGSGTALGVVDLPVQRERYVPLQSIACSRYLRISCFSAVRAEMMRVISSP